MTKKKRCVRLSASPFSGLKIGEEVSFHGFNGRSNPLTDYIRRRGRKSKLYYWTTEGLYQSESGFMRATNLLGLINFLNDFLVLAGLRLRFKEAVHEDGEISKVFTQYEHKSSAGVDSEYDKITTVVFEVCSRL